MKRKIATKNQIHPYGAGHSASLRDDDNTAVCSLKNDTSISNWNTGYDDATAFKKYLHDHFSSWDRGPAGSRIYAQFLAEVLIMGPMRVWTYSAVEKATGLMPSEADHLIDVLTSADNGGVIGDDYCGDQWLVKSDMDNTHAFRLTIGPRAIRAVLHDMAVRMHEYEDDDDLRGLG